MFRIVNDKAEAERIVRDGGAVRLGAMLECCFRYAEQLDDRSTSWHAWDGPYVVVREPEPKPLTNEEIVAELERAAKGCYGSAYYEGMGRGLLNAAKLVRERKL